MTENTPSSTSRYDVVVIGSGMGGLAAAAYLSRQGARVGVFDKHTKLGGYAQYFGKELCFDSDTMMLSGPAPGGWLHTVLSEVGALERLELISLEPSYRVRVPDHDLLIPGDAGLALEWLTQRFPSEAAGLGHFFEDMEQVGAQYLTLSGGGPGEGLLAAWQAKTAAEMLDDYVDGRDLKTVLAALWPLAGLPPSQLSALQFAALWHTFHQQGGTCVVRGGMKNLGQALADCVTDRGGSVELRAPVKRVLCRGRRAVGVELEDGRQVEGGVVICNANPHDLLEEMIPDESGGGVNSLGSYGPLQGVTSISAMQVHLGVQAPVEVPAQVTVVHNTYDSDDSFSRMQRETPEFNSFIISVLTHSDPERAPDGQAMVVLMALQPYGRPDAWHASYEGRRAGEYRAVPEYIGIKNIIADRLIAAAQAVIPGLGDEPLVRKVASPLTMERYTFNTGGAAFGWANIREQTGALRPGPRTPLRGLYLAGHWTFPGSGVSAAMVSGKLAAEAVLADR